MSMTSMITSTSNSKVKHVRRLQQDRRYREREQAYVVEGMRWLEEASAVYSDEAELFFTEAWCEDAQCKALLNRFKRPARKVDETVLSAMSDVPSPQGVIAVLPIRPLPLPSLPDLLLVLDGMQMPGNLGTVLRTAGAAGVGGVLLAPGCVDAYNPKVLRGAMGAHLRLPIAGVTWQEIGELTKGTTVWLADAEGRVPYTDVNWRRRATLIVGSEAHGGGPEARELAQDVVYIPMHANTESLNASMAAGVILFEAARQRRW